MVFFTLARRQDVWKNLKAEVDLLDGRKPSFTDLKGMTYLTWVLNESKYKHTRYCCGSPSKLR
jgi:hypothetical protein